jgi:hypothetical protein
MLLNVRLPQPEKGVDAKTEKHHYRPPMSPRGDVEEKKPAGENGQYANASPENPVHYSPHAPVESVIV